jgi:hypothetical protein
MPRVIENIKLSAGNITFGGMDMGFTGEGINVEITDETVNLVVDQSLSPVGKKLISRTAKVSTSLAEWALELLQEVIPGAVLTVDGTDPTKKMLDIPADDIDMFQYMKPLIIVPTDSTSANDHVTVWHAIPNVNMSFAYTKDKQRYYKVEFEAVKGTDGKFVTFGDTTVVGE